DHGTIVAEGTPTALRAAHARDELQLVARSADAIRQDLEARGYVFSQQGDVLRIGVGSSQDALTLLKRHEAELVDFEFRHGTMDDVFLSLVDPTSGRRRVE
ncbi:MAG TPA: hypothetical protein VFQ54_03985, partial [Thermomicrobiales bacterium]|nr:hypothetical protein [Thermomicrobiales bacterium]